MKRFSSSLTLLTALFLLGTLPAVAQQISLGTSKYKQSFDTLAATGTSSVMPNGWYFLETGTTVHTTYAADSGVNNQARTYSYGTNADRAMGTFGNRFTVPSFGAKFVNNTGSTITSLTVSFTTEQWKVGGVTRPDTVKAEMSTNATSLSTGTWTRVKAWDMLSVTNGAPGYRNGNLTANQAKVSYTLTGLSISNGSSFWLKWTDVIQNFANDGLAMDDFSVSTNATKLIPYISFAQTSKTVSETSDSVLVQLVRADTNGTSNSVKVSVASSSTAVYNQDYVYSGGTYTFPAHSNGPISFYIRLLKDTTPNAPKKLNLMLSNPTSATLGDSTMSITINDPYYILEYPISTARKNNAQGYPDTTIYGYWRGVVTSPNFSTNNGLFFTMTDKTGAVTVYLDNINLGYAPVVGDSLRVRGKVGSYYFQTIIRPDQVKKLNSGNKIPAPLSVNTINETNESVLVNFAKLTLTNPTQWDTTNGLANGGFTVQMRTPAGANVNVFISITTPLYRRPVPTFPMSLTGVNIQSSTTNPNTGYYLLPRFYSDLVEMKPVYHTIAQVKSYNATTGRADSVGVSTILRGVVHSGNIGVRTTLMYSLIDNTGAITVTHLAKVRNYNPRIGDSIQVSGTIAQNLGSFQGLTYISVDSVQLLGRTKTKFPRIVTKLDETTESDLVKLTNVTLVNPNLWDTFSTSHKDTFSVHVTDGKNTWSVMVTRNTDLYYISVPKGRFNISGIGCQKALAPNQLLTGYFLIPRGSFDLDKIPSGGRIPHYKIRLVKGYNPTSGIADSIGVYCYLRGLVYSTHLGTPAFGFSLADSTGAISVSGVAGFNKYTPVMGDSVEVRGTIRQSNGLTVIVVDSAGKFNTGKLNGGQPRLSLNEDVESNLVRMLKFVTLVNPAQWDTTGATAKGGFNVQVTDGFDTIVLRITPMSGLFSMPRPTDSLEVRGICLQSDPTIPYTKGYYLLPRIATDVRSKTIALGIPDGPGNEIDLQLFPNPFNGTISLKSNSAIRGLSVMNMQGQTLYSAQPGQQSITLDLTSLPAGMYVVQVNTAEGSTVKRIIRQ